MTPETLINAFATAVAHEEGFFVAGSVPQRCNNPCDLTDEGNVGYGVDQTGGPDGAKITIYPNVEAGWQAAYKKIARMLNGASTVYTLDMTILEVGLKWSGTAQWGINVAQMLGVNQMTTLAQFVSQGMTNHDNVQQATEEG